LYPQNDFEQFFRALKETIGKIEKTYQGRHQL